MEQWWYWAVKPGSSCFFCLINLHRLVFHSVSLFDLHSISILLLLRSKTMSYVLNEIYLAQ